MRRLLWIVPLLIAVAVTAYLLRPTTAPADPTHVAQLGDVPPIANSVTPAPAQVAAGSVELPITQIVLYSSGVGFFQREGKIDGNGRVDLSFPVEDVNDLLKSMVLQDLGGGRINAVSYDSHDPLDKTLDSFAIRLAKNPSQADVLTQARGEKVEITMLPKTTEGAADKNHSPTIPVTLQGTIMGVEVKPPKDGGPIPVPAVGPPTVAARDSFKQPVVSYYGPDMIPPIDVRLNVSRPAEVLNLWCADGMRSILLADVQRIKFLNPTVENEVRRALEVLARAHDTQKKAVSLHFNGDGKRPVRVGYVVESPLWRTSYRLLVDKEGKLFVQGWALVENPTNEDWKDVRMGLVSGRPISFKMDLYQPLYVPRPVVETEAYGAVKPVTHQGVIEQSGKDSSSGEKLSAAPGQFYQRANPKVVNAEEFGTEINLPKTSQVPHSVILRELPSQPTGGYISGSTVSNATTGIPQVPAPPALRDREKYIGVNVGLFDSDGSTGTPAPHHAQVSLQNGIIAAASAKDLGDTFQYAIDQPVSIPRQKSALLPIVNKKLDGDKVSVFNPSAHPKYPLLALRLKNTTGIHLMQGPISVFEGDGYCGDTQMPDLQPGEERLVSYALDLGTEVEAVSGKPSRKLVSLKLHKGVLSTSLKVHESLTYTLKNRSPHDRLVIIEHPYRPDFKIVSKEQPKERGRTVYRFEVKVPAGKTAKLEVAEEQDLTTPAPLARIDANALRFFLECELTNAKAKTALEQVLALQDKVAATSREAAQAQQQLTEITRDQERLRANLKEMPQTAAAYKRYLEKFDSQETTIEQLQSQIKQLRAQEQKQQDDLRKCVEALNVETTIQRSPPLPSQLGLVTGRDYYPAEAQIPPSPHGSGPR